MNEDAPHWAASADLFAFTPVPTGGDVSTKKSRKGTLIFFGVFLAYFIFTFYNFLAVNTPRINQFENPLDDDLEYDAPEMAFAFLRGDNLNESFYNTSYFFFVFEHVIIPQDLTLPRQYISIPLVTCRPQWLQPKFDLLCPSQPTKLQGLLYGSPLHSYPRMKVFLCNNRTVGSNCETTDNINWILMTGRLFVFLKQYAVYNYANGSTIPDSTPYLSYYYFLIMDMYNRAEVKVQAENITILPDLFTSFSDQKISTLKISGQNFYVSKVPTTYSHSLFVWWCSMSENTILTTVAFDTLLDVLSDVGAIWGVLFAVFTLYFWEYNRTFYYSKKPHMTNFDDKITPLVAATEKIQIAPDGSKSKSEETQVKSELLQNFLQKMVFDKALEMEDRSKKKAQSELEQPLREDDTLRQAREQDSALNRKDMYDYKAVYNANPDKSWKQE